MSAFDPEQAYHLNTVETLRRVPFHGAAVFSRSALLIDLRYQTESNPGVAQRAMTPQVVAHRAPVASIAGTAATIAGRMNGPVIQTIRARRLESEGFPV